MKTFGCYRAVLAGNRLLVQLLTAILALVPFATLVRGNESPTVKVVRVPEGGIQPQLQTDSRGRIHLIYFKGDPTAGDIFYARSDDGGATWSKPVQVNSQPASALAIGTVRGPRLALGRKDRVHVAWMGSKTAEPKVAGRTPMLYARLADAGDAFEPQRNIVQTHPGLDGGGTVAADPDGNVYVIWHAPDNGGKGEGDRRVWLARSSDDGKTFDPETAASPAGSGACGCCGLSALASTDGRVHILFRTANDLVHRDMELLGSDDRGKSFKVLANDPWEIGACVMSTAHLAGGRSVIAAWETRGEIRVLQLTPGGVSSRVFSVTASSRQCKHPSIACNQGGEYVVAWAEGTGWNQGGSVAWQVYDKEGTPLGRRGHSDSLPVWDAPAVFVTPEGGFGVLF